MKLGVFTVLFGDRPFEAALDRIAEAGLDCVEIGTGNYPGDAHCRPAELLADDAALQRLPRARSTSRGLEISALSCHGNPLHPQREVARGEPRDVPANASSSRSAWASTGSTCSAAAPATRIPRDLPELGDLRLAERVRRAARVAVEREGHPVLARAGGASPTQHGVRLGFEMHPGFVVYNPRTLLRLRDACGEAIGANLDPSHLFWQGIDVETAIAELGQGRRDLPHARQGHGHPSAQRRAQRRARHRAAGRGGQSLVDLPDRRVRPRRARLAPDPERAAAGRLRRRPLDRARGRAALDRRGLPQGRRLPAIASCRRAGAGRRVVDVTAAASRRRHRHRLRRPASRRRGAAHRPRRRGRDGRLERGARRASTAVLAARSGRHGSGCTQRRCGLEL